MLTSNLSATLGQPAMENWGMLVLAFASKGIYSFWILFCFRQQDEYSMSLQRVCIGDRGAPSITAVRLARRLVPRILPRCFAFRFTRLPAIPFPSFLTRYLTALQHNLGRDFMTRNINFYGSANPLANFIPRPAARERRGAHSAGGGASEGGQESSL